MAKLRDAAITAADLDEYLAGLSDSAFELRVQQQLIALGLPVKSRRFSGFEFSPELEELNEPLMTVFPSMMTMLLCATAKETDSRAPASTAEGERWC